MSAAENDTYFRMNVREALRIFRNGVVFGGEISIAARDLLRMYHDCLQARAQFDERDRDLREILDTNNLPRDLRFSNRNRLIREQGVWTSLEVHPFDDDTFAMRVRVENYLTEAAYA